MASSALDREAARALMPPAGEIAICALIVVLIGLEILALKRLDSR